MMAPVLVGMIMSALTVVTMNLFVTKEINLWIRFAICIAHGFCIPLCFTYTPDPKITGIVYCATVIFICIKLTAQLIKETQK